QRDADVGALLLAQVEALQERLGPVAPAQVAVPLGLEAGLALRLGHVAHDVRGEAPVRVDADEDVAPLDPGLMAAGEGHAGGADDPATVHEAIALDGLRVVRLLPQAVRAHDLPPTEERDEEHEPDGRAQVEAADRAVHAGASSGSATGRGTRARAGACERWEI